MFNTLSTSLPTSLPSGAQSDYNLPYQSLRPPGNTVNISSGTNVSKPAAMSAFQNLVTPYLQMFDRAWVTNPDGSLSPRPGMDTNPFHDTGKMAQGAQTPFQPTMDYNAIADRFFNRTEDQKQVRDYFHLPTFRQQPPTMWA
jgi:hypothetical protein